MGSSDDWCASSGPYLCVYPPDPAILDEPAILDGLVDSRALRLPDGHYLRPRPCSTGCLSRGTRLDSTVLCRGAAAARCLLSPSYSSSSPGSATPCSWPPRRHAQYSAEMCSRARAGLRSPVPTRTTPRPRTERPSKPASLAN